MLCGPADMPASSAAAQLQLPSTPAPPAQPDPEQFTPLDKMDLAAPFRRLLPAEPAQAAQRDRYAGPAAPNLQQASSWYDPQLRRFRPDVLPADWQSQRLAEPLAPSAAASAFSQEQLQHALGILVQFAAQQQNPGPAGQPSFPALQLPGPLAAALIVQPVAQV